MLHNDNKSKSSTTAQKKRERNIYTPVYEHKQSTKSVVCFLHARNAASNGFHGFSLPSFIYIIVLLHIAHAVRIFKLKIHASCLPVLTE